MKRLAVTKMNLALRGASRGAKRNILGLKNFTDRSKQLLSRFLG
jgi:hypothetical protein